MVLNVDGSSFGNPCPSGFGGVLRQPNGSLINGFAGSVGVSTILHVELLALYHGSKIAWDRGIRDLVCYSDSTLAIQLVMDDINPWHHYASIIANIKDLMGRSWRLQLFHSWREANAVANCLAKIGVASSNSWAVFDVPPAGVLPILEGDASRRLVARR